MNRKEYTLRCIDYKKGTGLELGPLYSPILLKEESKVYYVDHMSTNDLKEKYKDEPVPLHEIVAVDYSLGDKTLKNTFDKKKFDYVIASHVVEHIPDIVRWFQDIAFVLKPGGKLSLVIPDKRYTFDIKRNISRPADIMGAYLDKYTRTSSAQMFEYAMEIRDKIDPQYVWNNPYEDYSAKPFYYSRNIAYVKCLDNVKPDIYVDAHCNVFTPYSFIEILRCLIEYNIFDYEILDFVDTPKDRLEFYVTLKKMNRPNKAKQMKSLPLIKKDLEKWQIERENYLLHEKINMLETSSSWKITKPLREIKSSIKKLFF